MLWVTYQLILQSTALYLCSKFLKPVKLIGQVTIISFTEITGHE